MPLGVVLGCLRRGVSTRSSESDFISVGTNDRALCCSHRTKSELLLNQGGLQPVFGAACEHCATVVTRINQHSFGSCWTVRRRCLWGWDSH